MFRWRGERIVKVWKIFPFEGLPHNALERADHLIVLRRDKRKRVARTLGASSATDAVDVGVGGVGHIIVNDMGNAFDIKPACRDVGRDHDAEVSCLESAQGLFALSLCAVAMQACHAEPGVRDLSRHFVGPVFGAGKD